MKHMPLLRIEIMIKRSQNNIVPYESLIAYIYATLILELAPGIDKNIISDGYVLSEDCSSHIKAACSPV